MIAGTPFLIAPPLTTYNAEPTEHADNTSFRGFCELCVDRGLIAYYTLMIRLISALSLLATFALQAAPAADPWQRVASLYHQRLQDTGIVGSSLMFVKDGAVA